MKRSIFNKISILESLPDSELHTGAKLKDDIESYNCAYGRGLEIEFFDINNKIEFIDIINTLTIMANKNISFPVLHIDAHGSSDQQGVILKSGEFISWTELKPYLIRLNIATRLNLLVVFSLCYGAHFSTHLNPSDRAPCWGMIGPTKALGGPELLSSFSSFYKEVLTSGSADVAVKKLNASSSSDDINYYFTTASTFFIDVYKNYLYKLCTNESYDKRARAMRKKLKKNNLKKIPSIGEL